MQEESKSVQTIVFALPGFEHIQAEFCRRPGCIAGALIQESFPNGEVHRTIKSPVPLQGRDVIVVGSTDDQHMLPLLDFASELAPAAKSFHVVIPFYRYSTQERAKNAGEVITAKTRAKLLSEIPAAQGGNHFYLFDLHTPLIPSFFFGDHVHVHDVSLEEKTAAVIREQILLGIGESVRNIVIASPDSGRRREVKALAQQLGATSAFVDKKRISGSETQTAEKVEGEVAGRIVVIYDDMIRSGTTAIGAARRYIEAGANDVWLVATHADFAPGAVNKIADSKLFSKIIVSDSWLAAAQVTHPLVHINPIAQDIADRVEAIRIEQSPIQQKIYPRHGGAMRILLVVDVQNDFCPGGALAVPGGDEVVPVVNCLMREGNYDLVVASQDTHPAGHLSFASSHPGKNVFESVDLDGVAQTLWPDHCVSGTSGAEFHKDLDRNLIDYVQIKGTDPRVDSYSAFLDNGRKRETGLREFIEGQARARGVKPSDIQIDVVGLATDYCVSYTAIDAKELLGCKVSVLIDAARGIFMGLDAEVGTMRNLISKGVELASSEIVLGLSPAVARTTEKQIGISA